jgi:hypothetical protein
MQMKRTSEQQQCVDLVMTGVPVKIEAYAGTGKSTSLGEIGYEKSKHNQRGVLISFNASIAKENKAKLAARAPQLDCATGHSLAYRAICRQKGWGNDGLQRLLNAKRIPYAEMANRLKINDSLEVEGLHFSPNALAIIVRNAVIHWCQSDDLEIGEKHVKMVLQTVSEAGVAIVWSAIRPAAHLYWELSTDPAHPDPLPMVHDQYVKLWALSNPVIPGDYLMLDEAQDTNGVMIGVLRKQGVQFIPVGDRYQSIYEWRGARNAMSELETEHTTWLTQSFRFEDDIAEAATDILSLLGAQKPLLGTPGARDRAKKTTAYLARTNSGLIHELFVQLKHGKRVYVEGGTESAKQLVIGLQKIEAGGTSDHPELMMFRNRSDLKEWLKSEEGKKSPLNTLHRIAEERSYNSLLDALNATASNEGSADVILATAHASKGREYGEVFLLDDFKPASILVDDVAREYRVATPGNEEMRLLYVALTRGMSHVQPSSAYFDTLNAIKTQNELIALGYTENESLTKNNARAELKAIDTAFLACIESAVAEPTTQPLSIQTQTAIVAPAVDTNDPGCTDKNTQDSSVGVVPVAKRGRGRPAMAKADRMSVQPFRAHKTQVEAFEGLIALKEKAIGSNEDANFSSVLRDLMRIYCVSDMSIEEIEQAVNAAKAQKDGSVLGVEESLPG